MGVRALGNGRKAINFIPELNSQVPYCRFTRVNSSSFGFIVGRSTGTSIPL